MILLFIFFHYKILRNQEFCDLVQVIRTANKAWTQHFCGELFFGNNQSVELFVWIEYSVFTKVILHLMANKILPSTLAAIKTQPLH